MACVWGYVGLSSGRPTKCYIDGKTNEVVDEPSSLNFWDNPDRNLFTDWTGNSWIRNLYLVTANLEAQIENLHVDGDTPQKTTLDANPQPTIMISGSPCKLTELY